MNGSGGEDSDARLWRIVTATVRPLNRRALIRTGATPPSGAAAPALVAEPATPITATPRKGSPPRPRHTGLRQPSPPQAIEPGRRRRLERGRDGLAGSIDLHGLDQHRARDALTAFVLRAWAEHRRTVLVITGKGLLGDGVLRRRVPEWLGEPPLRQIVAGISEAHRRHGGEGAIYVALKRATPPVPRTTS